MRKVLSCFLFLFLAVVSVSPLLASDVLGQVAIFNARAGWIDAGTAQAQTKIFMDGVKLVKDIQVLGDKEIGTWAKANTKDGDMDTIILFGDFPSSLYAAGNAEANDSVGELFLEGGNMFLNTGDYIFYINNGAGTNGETGLKNMTDSVFTMWNDGNTNKPSDTGKKYTPSLPASFAAVRCFSATQVEADEDWELEASFGENGANVDPGIIHNVSYGGRVGIFYQDSNTSSKRGQFLIELFDNWLREVVKAKAVDPQSKLSTTWGTVKND